MSLLVDVALCRSWEGLCSSSTLIKVPKQLLKEWFVR